MVPTSSAPPAPPDQAVAPRPRTGVAVGTALADPDLLGVSADAALAVVATTTVLGVAGSAGQALAAVLGPFAPAEDARRSG